MGGDFVVSVPSHYDVSFHSQRDTVITSAPE